MSKQLLSNEAGRNNFDPTGIRTIDLPILNHMHAPLDYQTLLTAQLQPILHKQQALLQSESNIDHSKMSKSVKRSLEKSKNVLEEKTQNGQAKNLREKKTNTFTIIAINFVQGQLKAVKPELDLIFLCLQNIFGESHTQCLLRL